MASLSYMQLLRGNRSFRRLWAGQVVSELGNWFNFIAVLGLVRAVSHAAPEATAILVVLRLAPFAVLAPLAGALVDRWPRRVVMIASDAARAVFALGFLLVRGPEDLWIAYACTVVSTLLAAFFEGAKNAAMPNVVGDEGLLAGNALMFSSRFLLMAVGSALGGAASQWLGYDAAFAVNALSFLVSAYSIWLLPESEMRAGQHEGDDEHASHAASHAGRGAGWRQALASVWLDLRDGWAYIVGHRMVAALIGLNILWALGGGALNLVYDRMGSVVFAEQGGPGGDEGVAIIYTAVGLGLFVGMLLARRVGSHVEVRGITPSFMGWSIIAHGVVFALAGWMPTLWLAALMMMLSRVIIGVEFAVHETLMMRLLPDGLRGRIFTTDRAAEISVLSVSSMVAGWLLSGPLTARGLTVWAGLLSALPGVVWLLLFACGKLTMPAEASFEHKAREVGPLAAGDEDEDGVLVSAN